MVIVKKNTTSTSKPETGDELRNVLNSSDPQSKTLLALGEDKLGAWNGSGPRDIRDGVSTFWGR